MIFFVGRRWLGPAWRSHSCGAAFGWLLVLSSHTCACTQTHARTHTYTLSVPSDPGRFLPLADLLADACPVTVEEKEEERKWRLWPVPANRYPSRIRELCLTPGRPCSALAVGVRGFFFFFFFGGVWKCGRHIDFYPVANKGLGLQKSVKSPELNVLARRGSNDVSEKHWNNRKYLVWLLLISHLVSFLYFYMTFL